MVPHSLFFVSSYILVLRYWLRNNSYTATLRMEKESSQFPASTFFKPIQKLCLSFIDGKENILFSVDCSGMGNGTFDAGFKPNHPKSNSRVVSSALEVSNAKLKLFKQYKPKSVTSFVCKPDLAPVCDSRIQVLQSKEKELHTLIT